MNISTRSMPDKSFSVRCKFQPLDIKMFFISIPWSIPISRYNLPFCFSHRDAFFAMDLYALSPLSSAYKAMAGSKVAPRLTRSSLGAIYGGFDTIISNFVPKSPICSKVACFVLILSVRFKVRILRFATRRARLDLSIAIPDAPWMFLTNAHIIQPVPVPRSSIFGALSVVLSDIAAETKVSVSGRGSSVCRFV